jgi:glycosyltransferase involved in cell wall biosynthesis
VNEFPLISVAMACYNQDRYIKNAIKSIVDQVYTNWELVIVDDCSTDKSLKVISKCIKKYNIEDKVRIISNEKNKGYGYSLGRAISNSVGELVAVVDSDDALANDKSLEISVKIHLKHPIVSLTYSNYVLCRSDLSHKKTFKTKQINNFLKEGGRVSHLKVIKKKLYDMTGGIDPELKKSVDKDLVLKMEEVGKLFYINDTLYCYRQHEDNLSRSLSRKSKKYRDLVIKMRIQMYKNARKRRENKIFKMKIFVDGSKRAAVSRMFPIWNKLGHKVVNDPKDADVQLSVVEIKVKQNLPTVLRLNGVYYDKADNYNMRNVNIGKSHSTADAVVYQSNLSRKMCEKYLTKRETETYDVIYNGVNSADWGVIKKHKGINVVSCAKWRRFKRLPELVEIFKKFSSKRKGAVLHIIGPMGTGAEKIELDNVIYHGRLNDEQIKKIYKTADVYLHLAKKDSCPSSVVEAIGAGIPVITINTCGGATELCKLTKGCVIIEGEQESFEPDYIYRDEYNKVTREVRDGIIRAMIKVVDNKRRVVLPAELSIEHVAKSYLYIMSKTIEGKK